jgi:hypothetical protein
MTTTTKSVICVESHHHGDRFYAEGELYDAEDEDVRLHLEWFTDPLTPRSKWIQPGWEAYNRQNAERERARQEEAERNLQGRL